MALASCQRCCSLQSAYHCGPRVIDKAVRGGIPGLSGLTMEHVGVWMGDEICSRGLVCIIEDTVNGNFSAGSKAMREWLLGSELIAITKPASDALAVPDAAAAVSVRPLPIGEVLVKIAGADLLQVVKPDFPTIFERAQLSFKPNGRAAALLRIQLHIKSAAPSSYLIVTDVSNAFHCGSRHAIWSALRESPKSAPLLLLSLCLLLTIASLCLLIR